MNTTGFEALRDILGPNRYELKFYPAPGGQRAPFALICPGGSRDNLLGKTPTNAKINRCSVEKLANSHYPPTFVWCGDADKTVDPDNSKMLTALPVGNR